MVQYAMAIAASLLMGACGRKGPVEPLAPSDYPRTYPKPPPPDIGAGERQTPRSPHDGA